jgi:hypothetical protein
MLAQQQRVLMTVVPNSIKSVIKAITVLYICHVTTIFIVFMKTKYVTDMSICDGWTKSGTACRYKAKYGTRCGHHRIPDVQTGRIYDDCAICCEVMTERTYCLTDCKHELCLNCVKRLESPTCPFCRTPIAGEKITTADIRRMTETKRRTIEEENRRAAEAYAEYLRDMEELEDEEEEAEDQMAQELANLPGILVGTPEWDQALIMTMQLLEQLGITRINQITQEINVLCHGLLHSRINTNCGTLYSLFNTAVSIMCLE